MSIRIRTFSRVPRPAPLAACLASALGLSLSVAQASDAPSTRAPAVQGHGTSVFELPPYLRESAAKLAAAPMSAPIKPAGPPRYVTNCSGDPTVQGSLPYEVGLAADGATVDLSALACSVITLDWALAINQASLYLKGPAGGPSHLTIQAGNQSAVINHFGSSTLLISNLTIANGNYATSLLPTGGCIYSKGNVGLVTSVVSHCKISSLSASVSAQGGGVYTQGNLTLFNSTITDSEAVGQNGGDAGGGGAAVKGDFKAINSTITNNSAAVLTGGISYAGGAYVLGSVDIEGSTISGNRADLVGALSVYGYAPHTAKVINSTISSNIATEHGGIWTNTPMTVANSTIAFNMSVISTTGGGDGVYSWGSALTLNSSIIADNSGPGGRSDLGGTAAATATGANNLITSSTLPPLANTITSCPQLEPLANNGGATRTHALQHTSPAIDQGDAGSLTLDQRGAPRTAGAQADIGSVEWQPGETDERILANGFDGLCDQ